MERFQAIPRRPLYRRVSDALHYRFLIPLSKIRSMALGVLKHRLWRRLVPFKPSGDLLLHVGCGREALPGWINVDIRSYSEADLALDVTRGLPFSGLQRIFSEHFLEHLDIESALNFLVDANRRLAEGGWLRLTTPNLDWVWTMVYSPEPSQPDRLLRGLHANRAFYGWQHRFIWNRELLEAALQAAGFADIRWCRWGRSSLAEFDGLERHERYPDTREIPHVLVAEARKGTFDPVRHDALRRLLRRELVQCLEA